MESEVVDALFVDIILKGEMQAGIELAKRAVEHKPNLKVLYSTGLAVTDDLKALVVPGSTILEKPYSEDLANLFATLGRVRSLTLMEIKSSPNRGWRLTRRAWLPQVGAKPTGPSTHRERLPTKCKRKTFRHCARQ
jgi:hypothetical protein